MLTPHGILAVKEHSAGNRTEDPANAVAELREVDAECRILRRPEHGRVGVGHRFQEGQSGGDEAHAEQKSPEGRDIGRGDEPKPAYRHYQQADDDAALVADLGRQPARRQRHQKIAEIVGKLHPCRLC